MLDDPNTDVVYQYDEDVDDTKAGHTNADYANSAPESEKSLVIKGSIATILATKDTVKMLASIKGISCSFVC